MESGRVCVSSLEGQSAYMFKVEYHANENPLNNSEKILYVGPKNNTLQH